MNDQRPLRPSTLYCLFTISGACGLAYQVLWARWLSLVLGSTTASVSIVLASFMLGLALGSWAAGRTLSRVRRPLRVYALLEMAIGFFALAFPLLTRGAERVLAALVDAESPWAAAIVARAAIAFILLLVPTTLMGATLPQLAHLLRRLGSPGSRWRLGLLYALNTAGAAAGSLLVSFVGIELIGIRATSLLAALLNLVVGLLALRGDAATPTSSTTSHDAMPRASSSAWLPLGVLAMSGGAALAGEVLWTRWLEVLVGNSSYAFALMLVVYLVGIAAGSGLPSLQIGRLRHLEVWLLGTQLAAAAWLIVAVHAFDGIAANLSALHGGSFEMPALLSLYARAAFLLLPSALLSGAVFPFATRLLAPGEADAPGAVAARAYSWNTVGAVIGALVGGWIIAPRFDFAEAMLVLAAAYAAVAVIGALLARPQATATRRLTLAAAVAGVLVAALAVTEERGYGGYAANLERSYPNGRVLYHARGAQGITTVLAPKDDPRFGAVLLVNATGMTRLVTSTKMMAHLPLMAHPAPRETLVICFGMGTTFRSAMTHGGHVTAVELVPEVLDAFSTFHLDAARVSADPRGRRLANDGRNFLLLTRQRFDVITIDPPPPIDGAGVNHLYSRDFLRLAHSRLRPGGIMAHWIPYPQSSFGVVDWSTFGMLVRSFTDVFPYVVSISGIEPIGLHLLGSDRPIDLSPERVRAALADPAVAADVDEWRVVPPSYFLQLRPIDPNAVQRFPPVTDDRPRLEFDLIHCWRNGVGKRFHTIFW